MRFVLYANASEVKFGEKGYVAQYDFFCVAEKVHIRRETKYDLGYDCASGLAKTRWFTPTACNGSCRVWLDKELNIPAVLRQQCLELMKERAAPVHECGLLALHLHRTLEESWYAVGTFRDKSMGKSGQRVIADTIADDRMADMLALLEQQ